jgi:creatinine amidohydrolase
MVLRLRPELVGDYAATADVPFGRGFEPAARGWITKDRTEPGHIGQPRYASAAKGETLFRVFTDDVVKLLERALQWNGTSWDG